MLSTSSQGMDFSTIDFFKIHAMSTKTSLRIQPQLPSSEGPLSYIHIFSYTSIFMQFHSNNSIQIIRFCFFPSHLFPHTTNPLRTPQNPSLIHRKLLKQTPNHHPTSDHRRFLRMLQIYISLHFISSLRICQRSDCCASLWDA